MNPPEHDGARQALHLATKEAHRSLDRHSLLSCLLSRNLTIDQYADALQALFVPHTVLEQRVYGHAPAWMSIAPPFAPRSPLLAADLKALDRCPPAPTSARPAEGECDATWLGRVYVLEGSRLGAAVIARRVGETLGSHVPLQFFNAGISAAQWQSLCALMEQQLSSPDALTQAAASARTAFEDYRRGLERASTNGAFFDNRIR